MEGLHEIGLHESENSDIENALVWVRRAFTILQGRNHFSLNDEVQDLSMNVLHTYTRLLHALKTTEYDAEVSQALALLRQHHGHKLAVTVLELEISIPTAVVDTDAFSTSLTRLFSTMPLIGSTHSIATSYILRLRTVNNALACQLLKDYILKRLGKETDCPFIEDTIVTLIWMFTDDLSSEISPNPKDLRFELKVIFEARKQPLCAVAAHAALVLLWKIVEGLPPDQFNAAIDWCEVIMLPLFENAGCQSIGAVERKLTSCYMANSDYDRARLAFERMTENQRTHPLTLRMWYFLALYTREDDELQRALNRLANVPKIGYNLLIECVPEPMRLGTKRQGANLLQRILDKVRGDSKIEVDRDSLLRCTIRSFMSVLAEGEVLDEEILSRLCKLFKAASRDPWTATQATVPNSQESQKYRWLYEQAYTLAISVAGKGLAAYAIDLLYYASELLRKAPREDSGDSLRRADLLYLQAVLYLDLARGARKKDNTVIIPLTATTGSSDQQENTLASILYKDTFDRASAIETIVIHAIDVAVAEQIADRKINLIPAQFEALLELDRFSEITNEVALIQVIQQAQKVGAPEKTFSLVVDLIISAALQGSIASESSEGQISPCQLSLPCAVMLLRKIIDAVRNLDQYDIPQASRWIRCVIQLVLDARPAGNLDQVSSNLLDEITAQAISLARSSLMDHAERSTTYPADELEWLATVLFNLALDAVATGHAGSEDEAERWARRAIEVARVLAVDGGRTASCSGALLGLLQERCKRLGWEV